MDFIDIMCPNKIQDMSPWGGKVSQCIRSSSTLYFEMEIRFYLYSSFNIKPVLSVSHKALFVSGLTVESYSCQSLSND